MPFTLRTKIIKLAHNVPELRKHLVPMLRGASSYYELADGYDEDQASDYWNDEKRTAEQVLKTITGLRVVRVDKDVEFDRSTGEGSGTLTAECPVGSLVDLVTTLTKRGFVLEQLHATPEILKQFKAVQERVEDLLSYLYFEDKGRVKYEYPHTTSWVECGSDGRKIDIWWTIQVQSGRAWIERERETDAERRQNHLEDLAEARRKGDE
jgi:hypothetical protein